MSGTLKRTLKSRKRSSTLSVQFSPQDIQQAKPSGGHWLSRSVEANLHKVGFRGSELLRPATVLVETSNDAYEKSRGHPEYIKKVAIIGDMKHLLYELDQVG